MIWLFVPCPKRRSGCSLRDWGCYWAGRLCFLGVLPSSLPRRLMVLVSPLPGEFLSLVWPRERNQREGHPDIRPRLWRGSLPPVPLRGPAYTGLPCPVMPLAAIRAARPPARHLHSASWRGPSSEWPESFFLGLWLLLHSIPGSTRCPFRRANGIVAQRDEPQGSGERRKGPGKDLVCWPLERRWRKRTLRKAQGRMKGGVFANFLCTSKATKRSGVTATGWPEG